MVNRRMFRPWICGHEGTTCLLDSRTSNNNGPAPSKKPAPPELTHAENFYWVKQMQARTPMAIVLDNGEILRGTVEWYDRDCIKLTRHGEPQFARVQARH